MGTAALDGELAVRTEPLRIREMPRAERPGERVRTLGAGAVTTRELLAVALGVEFETADALLAAGEGSLRRLAMEVPARLVGLPGVRRRRALQLKAALELGRRLATEVHGDRVSLRSPREVYEAVRDMEDLPVEVFVALGLDAQHQLLRRVEISRGIVNSSLVHPREVFREVIAERASAVILVHNHPSGDPTPSAHDRLVTEQLVAAGRLLDIPVHDHVIIGRGRYTSFAEAALL